MERWLTPPIWPTSNSLQILNLRFNLHMERCFYLHERLLPMSVSTLNSAYNEKKICGDIALL